MRSPIVTALTIAAVMGTAGAAFATNIEAFNIDAAADVSGGGAAVVPTANPDSSTPPAPPSPLPADPLPAPAVPGATVSPAPSSTTPSVIAPVGAQTDANTGGSVVPYAESNETESDHDDSDHESDEHEDGEEDDD